MKYSIGVDVGKNGGIVVIDEKGNILTTAMPQVKKEIDTNRIIEFLSSYMDNGNQVHCGIEDVHSIFGASAKSNFQFGRAAGIIEAAVVACGYPFTKIAPKVWQKEMWAGVSPVQINTGKKTKDGNIKFKTDTKATSLIAVQRLFPKLDLRATQRSTTAHDGIVDAVLICEFVRRKLL